MAARGTDIPIGVTGGRHERASASAEDATRGLVLGSPVLLAIEERGTAQPATIIEALAEALAHAGGRAPLRLPMSALVFLARAV